MGSTSKRQLSSPRPRIVSLAPSVTSILWAIGARGQVVGVSKWCAEVAAVGRLPRVGDCWAADPAEIGRLRPTLLIGSVPFKAEMVTTLLELGVPLVATNPRSLEDVYADIRLLGGITGRAAKAEGVAGEMRRALNNISKSVRGRTADSKQRARPVRVYCEAWPHPRISSPPWVAELVRIAGGEAALPPGRKVSDEEVAKAAPEVIILAWTATGEKSDPRQALENRAWQDMPAVRNARVFAVRDELLNTPSPILVRGARELARIIRHASRGT